MPEKAKQRFLSLVDHAKPEDKEAVIVSEMALLVEAAAKTNLELEALRATMIKEFEAVHQEIQQIEVSEDELVARIVLAFSQQAKADKEQNAKLTELSRKVTGREVALGSAKIFGAVVALLGGQDLLQWVAGLIKASIRLMLSLGHGTLCHPRTARDRPAAAVGSHSVAKNAPLGDLGVRWRPAAPGHILRGWSV